MVSEVIPDARPSGSRALFWIGWVFSILPSLVLLMSGAMKIFPTASTTQGMEEGLAHLGWRMDQMTALGLLEVAVVVVYLIPRTAVLGAILTAGYMGGAIATHARVGDPFIVQAIVGVLFWLGLWLREPRLREVLPVRK